MLGQSIPHRRLYASKELGSRRVFLIFQVSTEDYAKTGQGFRLIYTSLRSSEILSQNAK